MTSPRLSILLVSDIHAFTSEAPPNDKYPPSYIDVSRPTGVKSSDVFFGLEELIRDQGLKPDIVVCAGDMGDKASDAGLAYVWQKLGQLATATGASTFLATAGNHDVDSRYAKRPVNPIETLKALRPPFPGLPSQECDRYWSRHFAILDNEHWRVVLVNSSAHHGTGRDQKLEFEQGRITDQTIRDIEEALNSSGERKLNILVCHHHPIRNNQISEADYTEMQGGEALVHVLGEWNFGPWVMLHGHKHHPRVVYAQGPSTSPIIVSAGSLSVRLYSELASLVRNQCYLIDFPIAEFDRLGLDVAGHVRAWDWIPNRGWQDATDVSGLPRLSGFGKRLSITGDADQIARILKSQIPGTYISRQELESKLPWLAFVLPTDGAKLLRRLKLRGFNHVLDERGDFQIGIPSDAK